MTCNFLILDEVSMLGCAKLASISKMLEKNKSNSLAFGGVHILFSGDFFQLPAIGDICLYRIKSIRRKDSDAVVLGMYLWSQVIKTTVLLVEHYRAPNPEVYEVMERMSRHLNICRHREDQSKSLWTPRRPRPKRSEVAGCSSYYTSEHHTSSVE